MESFATIISIYSRIIESYGSSRPSAYGPGFFWVEPLEPYYGHHSGWRTSTLFRIHHRPQLPDTTDPDNWSDDETDGRLIYGFEGIL
jgi:hypothetical protein